MYLGVGGFLLQLTTTARLRRLTANVGVVTALCGPAHPTIASNLRRQRLHRVAETDCSMTRARFIALPTLILAQERFLH